MRGGKNLEYEPAQYMSVNQAAEQLLHSMNDKEDSGGDAAIVNPRDLICVGVARVGSPSQTIICETLDRIATHDFGAPLHSLIVCGELHPIEAEFLLLFSHSDRTKKKLSARK